MSKLFVILSDIDDDTEETEITGFLRAMDYDWWHYTTSSWIIKVDSDDVSAETLRDRFYNVSKNSIIVVIEIDQFRGWGASAPNSVSDKAFPWLNENLNYRSDEYDPFANE